MYIEKFSFYDKTTGWKIENAEFGNLSLLVGISGVGKTRILEAIKILPRLVQGEPFSGIAWAVEFRDSQGKSIVWKGETEVSAKGTGVENIPDFVKKLVPKYEQVFPFLSEIIDVDGTRLAHREDETTYFQETKTVKLAKDKSLLYILKEEELIQSICSSIHRIYTYTDEDWICMSNTDVSVSAVQKLVEKNVSARQKVETDPAYFANRAEKLVIDSGMGLANKLFFLESQQCPVAQKIKGHFYSIFTFVKELRYVQYGSVSHERFTPDTQMYVLQLQEHGADTWINSWDFSSGILKTLNLLVALYTSPTGSVFLIDEFENSFGVNCIDSVADILLERADSIQCVLTSHHPYIINKLPTRCWKLVTRKGSTVSLAPVEPLLSKVSKHEAFIQLLNLKQYIGGISA